MESPSEGKAEIGKLTCFVGAPLAAVYYHFRVALIFVRFAMSNRKDLRTEKKIDKAFSPLCATRVGKKELSVTTRTNSNKDDRKDDANEYLSFAGWVCRSVAW